MAVDKQPFSWPDPTVPARFFTEEGFAKYSMSLPPSLMDALQKIPEEKLRIGARQLHYQPVLERLPLKGKSARDLRGLETLKPGFNYPHYSQMTEGLMKYFHFLKTKYGIKGERVVSEQEAKQHQQWVLFQKQVLKEQEEFQVFAKQVAMASADDFSRLLPGTEEYIAKCLEANRKRVLGYPQLYRMNQTVSLKADPVLPSDPQLTMLMPPRYQSDVRLLHWRQFKDDNHQYLCEGGNAPSSAEVNKVTSSLSSEGCQEGVDIVISMEALTTLVDNHQPENYPHQWEIPFTVKTTQMADGKLQKTVFLEDPFMAHNYHPNTANNLLASNLMREHLIREGAKTILNRKKSGTQDQTRTFRKRFCVSRSKSLSQEESGSVPVAPQQQPQDDDDPFGSNAVDITALETLGSGSFFASTKHDVKPSKHKTPSASNLKSIQFVKSGLTLHDEKKALLDSLDGEPPTVSLNKTREDSLVPQQGSKEEDDLKQGSEIEAGNNFPTDTCGEVGGGVEKSDTASRTPDQRGIGISSLPDPESLERGIEESSNVRTGERFPGTKGDRTNCEPMSGDQSGLPSQSGGSAKPSGGDDMTPQESKHSEETSGMDNTQDQIEMPGVTGEGKSEQVSNGELAEPRSSITSSKFESPEAKEKLAGSTTGGTKISPDDRLSDEDIFSEKEPDLIMDTSALDNAMRSCLAKDNSDGPGSALGISDPPGDEGGGGKEQGIETGRRVKRVTRGMARNEGKKTNVESDAAAYISPPSGTRRGTAGPMGKRHTRSAVKKEERDGAGVSRRTRSLSTSGEGEQMNAKRTRSGRLVRNAAKTEDENRSSASEKESVECSASPSSVGDKNTLGAKRTKSGRVTQKNSASSGKEADGKSAVVSVEEDGMVQAKRTRSGRVVRETATMEQGVHNTRGKSDREDEISSPTSTRKSASVCLTPPADEDIVRVKRTRSGKLIADRATKKSDEVGDKPIPKGKISKETHPSPSEEESILKRTTRSGKVIGTTPGRKKDEEGQDRTPETREEQPIVVRRATRRRSARSGRVIGTKNVRSSANNPQENETVMKAPAKGAVTENAEGSDKAGGYGRKQKSSEDQDKEPGNVGESGEDQEVLRGKVGMAVSCGSESELKMDCSGAREMVTGGDNDMTNKEGSPSIGDSPGMDDHNKDISDHVPPSSRKSTKSAVVKNLPRESSSDNELHMDVDMADGSLVEGPPTVHRDVIGGDEGKQSETPGVSRGISMKKDSNSVGMDDTAACNNGASDLEAMKEGDNATDGEACEAKKRNAESNCKLLAASKDGTTLETPRMEASSAVSNVDDASRYSGKELTLTDRPHLPVDLPGDSSQSEQELLIDLGEDGSDGPGTKGTNLGKSGVDKSPPKLRMRKQRNSQELNAGATARAADTPKVGTTNSATMPLLDNILKLQKKLIASKKGVEKEEKTALTSPTPPMKAPQTPGSVFDSIFQDQRELFKIKFEEENVEVGPGLEKGGAMTRRGEVSNQRMSEERADTSLWKVGKLRMCLRGGIDGIYWDYKAKKMKAASVYAKVEQQPWFGFEQVSMGEISRLWLKAALFPDSSVLRGRIHCHSSELMKLEVLNINNIGAWTQFQPAYAVKVLHNIFNKLLTLSNGSYLLMHHAGGPQAFIYSTVEEATAHRFIIYDLHAEHQKATLHQSPPAEIPWAPLDPNLQLPRSDPWQIPCIFPPPPYVQQHEYYNTRQFNPYEGLHEPKKKRKKKKKNASTEGQAKQGAKSNQQQKSSADGADKSGAKTGQSQKSHPGSQVKTATTNQQQGKPGMK